MNELVRYDAMCRAIDKAFEIDEVKDIRDKAAMLEAAMRVAGNRDAEMRCWEIRQRAQRKATQLYDASEKAKGAQGNPGGRGATVVRSEERTTQYDEPKTLAEHGISKQRMSEWRELAKVPEEEFNATLAQAVAEGTKLSVDEITGKKPIARSHNSTVALWVWGRMLNFEDNGTLALPPADCIAELAWHQVDDIKRLGPQVVDWLSHLVTLAKGQTHGEKHRP